ncbi:MAG: methionine adenosyltransferase, partial [Gammaproteobacteria bacterium]|nr:methionine adenosyltransferase [Gammaproteobacteria bacterium]
MPNSLLFTSESVSEGHPDKVADQVSDSILDALLAQDPRSRVGCETLINTGMVLVSGEITSTATVDFPAVVRSTIADIGYTSSEMGFDAKSCAVLVSIDKQSPDIARGVNEGEGLDLDQGAGDQGLMYGYACNETDVLMPFPITTAHRLVEKQAQVRKAGKLPWLRPDAKSQVTVRYVDGKVTSVDTVVLSTQHQDGIAHGELSEAVVEEIIKPVLPAGLVTKDTRFLVNPTG